MLKVSSFELMRGMEGSHTFFFCKKEREFDFIRRDSVRYSMSSLFRTHFLILKEEK